MSAAGESGRVIVDEHFGFWHKREVPTRISNEADVVQV
jgi:hypothetical protein